jgi:hypothetical protein
MEAPIRNLNREKLSHPADVPAFVPEVDGRDGYFVEITIPVLTVYNRHLVRSRVLPT